MENIIANPLLWVGLAFIMIVSITVGITIHKRRTKEVEELNEMFPVPERPRIEEDRKKSAPEQLRIISTRKQSRPDLQDDPAMESAEEAANKAEDAPAGLDMVTSRRLYKKSLLSPMQMEESSLHELEIRETTQTEATELPLGATRREMNKRKESDLKELEEPMKLPSRSTRKSKKKRL
jgi:hypothetical protein